MREIKFRVFDNTPTEDGFKGVMIDHNYVIDSDYLIDALNGKYPLMQFTGLLDKNGKEIYEGDIINHKDPKGYKSEKWEVIFYSGAFWIAGLPRKIRIYNIGDRLNKLEIIANIHETNF